MRVRALLLLAIAAGIHAGPVSFEETQCATTCVPSTKFGYETGSTYRFSYEADTVTSLAGLAEEHSALHVGTTADVHVLSPCELVLTLRDTRLEGYDPRDLSKREASRNNAEFRRDLEARGLRFSFQDGRVETVCASEYDATWVVNFKRGVLTAFQNSMPDFDDDSTVMETDVSGNCEAAYTLENTGINTVTLTKTKNLLACMERSDYFSSLQATPYKVPSEVQSLPLLRSTHTCEQTVSSGFLVRSECEESHAFRPFSQDESAAQTVVKQSLIYQGIVNVASSATGPTRRTTLLFEHEARETAHSNDVSLVTDVLRDICESTDIRPQTPRLFTQLIYNMRKMDVASLRKVHKMVEANRICSSNMDIAKKFFHDAIPSTGTESSVALIRDLTMDGEIIGEEADMWLSSLAFIPQPTAQMIDEAKNLLNSVNRQAYLSVSTLVHTYCKYNTDCETNSAVQSVLSKIVENLGYNCRVNSQDEAEKLIISLKALGNGGWSNRATTTLARCVGNTDNIIEVRLAAIEAYRRLPCDQSRGELIDLLKTTSEDVEVRIASYLALMQCPTESVINDIKDVLQSEEVNQVGSFIWTHLTNLMETSDPFKQDIRAILEDEALAKEFNMDARKFSRNYEGSFFFDSINAGARYESNIIWSPSSFLPRSAMLNLTVDMFGKSVNLLEIGGRAEGLEKYLEMMFGPKGYFPNSGVNDAINARLANVDEQLRRKMQTDPKASAYMKLFGNELRFWDTDFSQDADSFNFLNFLITLAKDHQVELTRSMMFLDSEMTVPTMTGFPLKLAVNGTAVVNVKVGGKMDLRRVAAFPSSLLIDGYLKPSAAVTVSATMGVDMTSARTGMRLVSTMHTSTQMTGKVELQESQVLTATFNAPEQKQEILNVETKFFIIHKDQETEQKMLSDGVTEEVLCSGEKITKVTGLKLCYEVSMPIKTKSSVPRFPMTASWFIEKADTHSGYELELRAETRKERLDGKWAYTNVARLYFDTPGSRTDREFLIDFTLDQAAMKLNANLKTPWKDATLDGSLIDTAELLGANLAISVDNRQSIDFNAELAMQTFEDGLKFTPAVRITTPWIRPISLQGQAKVTPGPNIDADITLDAFNAPVTLKGTVQLNGARYVTDVAFTSPMFNSKVSGYTAIKDNTASTRMELSYDYNTAKTHRFVLNGKYKDSSTAKAVKYSLSTSVDTSEYPDYNFEIKTDVLFSPKHAESNMEFQYGSDSNDVNKRVVFNTNADYKGNLESFELDKTWGLKWKAMGINMHGKVTHFHDVNSELKTQAMLSYSPGNDIKLNVNVRATSVTPLSVLGDLELSYPGRELRLYKDVEETTPGTYNTQTIIQWQSGKQIRVQSVYVMDSLKHTLRTEIYRPSGELSVINGAVTLNLKDFDAKLSLEHNDKKYSTALDYAFSPAQMEVTGNFDLSLPMRHVTIETAATARPGDYSASLSTFWDADKDKSKKAIVKTALQSENGKHEGQIKVIYPGRKLALSVNQELTGNAYSHHSELTWAQNKAAVVDITTTFTSTATHQKVEGNAAVKTPFFRDVKANANYEVTSAGVQAGLDLDYGKVLSAEFNAKKVSNWRNAESNMNIHTPFAGWERLSLATKHNLETPMKTVHVEFSKNDKKIEVDATGKSVLETRAVEVAGGVTIKSPFSQDIGFETSHTYNGETMNSQLKASFGNKEVTTVVNVNHEAESLLNHRGTFTIKTPSRVIKEIESNWRSTFNGLTDIKFSHDVRVNNNKLAYTIVNQVTGNELTTSISAETTFQFLKNVALVTTCSFTTSSLNGVTTFTLNDNQLFLLKADLADAGLDCEAKFQITSKLLSVNDWSIHLYRKESQTPTINHAEFKWAPNKVISLDYEETSNPTSTGGELRVTTPYRHLERIVLNLNHNEEDGKISTSTFLEYAPSKRISAAFAFESARATAMSFEITAPCPYFRELKGQLSHGGFGTSFEHKSNLAFTMDGYSAMEYSSELSMRGASYLVGHSEITTPCPYLRNPKLMIDHQFQGNEYISKAGAAFYDRNEINIETHFQNNVDQFKISGQLDSTIQYLKSMSFGIEHQGSGLIFTGSGHLESRIAEYPITYTHTYEVRGFRAASADIKFQTPSIDQLSYTLMHSVSGNIITTNSVAQISQNKKIVFNNKVNIENGLKVVTELFTPFDKLRSLNVDIDHVGTTASFFTCKASIAVDNAFGQFNIDSDVTVNRFERVYGLINILNLITVKVDHTVSEGINSLASISSGQKSIQLTYQLDRTTDTQTLTFNSPFRGYEEIQLIQAFEEAGNLDTIASLTLKYAPNKQIRLELENSRDNPWKQGLRLRTSFAPLSYAYVGYNHEGELKQFNNNFKLEYTTKGKTTSIEGNSVFRLSRRTVANFNLQSNIPGFSQLEVNSNLDLIGERSFEGKLTVTYPSSQLKISSDLNAEDLTNVRGSFEFSGPAEISLSFTHNGEYDNFENKIEVFINRDVSTFESSFSMVGPIKGKVTLTTPYRPVRFQQIAFNFEGRATAFTSDAEWTNDKNDKIAASGSFYLRNGLRTTFSLACPWIDDINININHEGVDEFQHETRLSYGQQVITLNGTLQTKPMQFELQLTTPFTEVRSLSIDGRLNWDTSRAESYLALGLNSHSGTLKGEFSNGENIYAKISVGSTINQIDGLSIELFHNCDMPEFSTKATVLYGSKKIFLDTGLTTNPVSGHFKFQSACPYLRDIDISLQHSGDVMAFQSNIEASVNGRKIDGKVKYDARKDITGNFEINLPLLPAIRGSLAHKSTESNLDSEFSVSLGKTSIKGEANFKLNPIDGLVRFTSPCPYFRDVSLILRHTASNDVYQTSMILDHDRFGQFSFTQTLQFPRLEAQLHLETPYKYLKNVDMEVSHVGDLFNFENKVKLNHDILGQFVYEGSLKDWVGDFKVTTPISKVRNLQFTFSHDMQAEQSCSSNAVLQLNGNELVKAEASFQKSPLQADASLILFGKETYHLIAKDSKQGSIKDFDFSIEIKRNKKSLISLQAKFDATDGVSGELGFVSKWTKSIDLTFSHAGSLQNFECSANLKYANSDVINGNLRFALEPLTLALSLQTKYSQLRSLASELKFVGDVSAFDTELSIRHNDKNVIDASAEFSLTPTKARVRLLKLQFGTFSLQDIVVAVSHEGNADNFKTNLEASMEGKTISATLEFDRRPLSITITATTPFRRYEQIGAAYNQRGNWNAFSTHAEVTYSAGKTIEIDASFKNYQKFSAVASVKTPFGEGSTNAKFQKGDNSFTSSMDLRLGSYKIDATAEMQFDDSPSGRIQLNTPITGWQEISLSFSHQTANNGITTNVKGTANGRSVDVLFKGSYSGLTDMAGELTVTTPFRGYEQFQFSVNHKGDLRSMQTDVKVVLPKENVFEGTLILTTARGFNAELKTNIRGLEDITFELVCSTNLGEFSTSAMIRLSPNKVINAALAFTNDNKGISSRATFTSPFRNLENISATFKLLGTASRFDGTADLNWGDKQLGKLSVNGALPTSMSATFESPYTQDLTCGWTFNTERSGNIFFSWSPTRRIEASFEVAVNGDISELQFDGKVDVSTPFTILREINVITNHEHSSSHLTNALSVAINGREIIDHHLSLYSEAGFLTLTKPVPVSIVYKREGNSGEIKMDKPVSFDMSYTFSSNVGSLKVLKPIPIDIIVSLNDNSGEFKMTKPYPVDVSVTLSDKIGSVKVNEPFQFDLSYNLDSSDGAVEMKYPYDISANYKLGREAGSMRMRGLYDVDAAYLIKENGGSINVQGPYQINAKYSMDSTSGSIDIALPIAVKAEYSFGRNGGTFTMQEPIPVDMQIALTDQSASFVMTQPYQVDVSSTLSWNEFSFVMQNPVPVDIQTSLTEDSFALLMAKPYPFDVALTYSWNNVSIVMKNPTPVNIKASLQDLQLTFLMIQPYKADLTAKVSWNEVMFLMNKPVPAEMRAGMTGNGATIKLTGPFPIDAAFTFNGYDGSLTVAEPFPVDASYEIEGTSGYLQISAPIQIKLSYDVSNLEGAFSLEGLYNADASYSIGRNAGFVKMNKPYKVDAQYTMDSASGSIDIEKPIAIKATYSFDVHGGTFKMQKPVAIDASLTLNYNNGAFKVSGPITIDSSYTWDGQSGSVTMTSPFAIQTTFKLKADEGSFNMQQPYKVDARYTLGQYEGSVIVKKPFVANARYTLERDSQSFSIEAPYIDARVTMNTRGGAFTVQQPITVDASYTLDGNSASFRMQKPFQVLGEGTFDGTTATLTVSKPLQVALECSFDGRKASFNMQRPYEITMGGHLDRETASFNMIKPFRVSADGSFDGRRGTFEMQQPFAVSIEGHLDETSASFVMNKPFPINTEGSFDGIRATFVMRQPYSMSMQGHYDGQSASFTVDNPVPITLEGSFDGTTVTLKMTQPYQVTAVGSFNGRTASFSIDRPVPISAEGSINDNTLAFTLRQPYRVSAQAYFDGQKASFNIDNPIPISIEGSYDTNTLKFAMRQPYQVSAEAYFDGQKASFNIDNPIPISIEGSFDTTTVRVIMLQPYKIAAEGYFDGKRASINIDKPIPISVEGSFDGNSATFNMLQPYYLYVQGHLDERSASFNMKGPYVVSTEGTFDGTRGSFIMEQPYPISLTGHFDGRSASVDMEGPYTFSADGSFDGNQGKFTMRQPYQISAAGNYDGRSASVDIDGLYPVSADGSFDGTRGSFTMRKPYSVSLSGHLDGRSGSIDMAGPYTISADGSLDDSRAVFNMRKPYPVSVESGYDGRSASIDVSGMYALSAQGHLDSQRGGFSMTKPYEMSVQGMYDGQQASFDMDRPYPVSLSGSFDGNRGSLNVKKPYAMSADGHFDGYSVSFSIDKPYPISFRGNLGEGKGSFVMQSPMEIDAECTYSLRESSFTMTKPYPIDASYSIGSNSGSFTMTKPYAIEGTYTLTLNGGSLNVVKPIAIVASAEYADRRGAFQMQRPYSFDVNFNLADNIGEINMQKPLPMKIDYEYEGGFNAFNGRLGVNWNTQKRDSEVQLIVTHSDLSTESELQRSGGLKVIMPTRTVGMSASIFDSATNFMQTAEIIWDDAKDRKMSYLIDLKDTSRRSNNAFELQTLLNTPVRSFAANVQHSQTNQAQNTDVLFKWDATRDVNKQVTFSRTLTTTSTTGQHTLAISSPLLDNDIVLNNEWIVTANNVLFSSRHELSYSVDTRNNLVFATKLSDEGNTRYGNHNYTAYFALSHKASTIDIEVTSHFARTDRAISTGTFINYMMAHGNYETLQWYAEANKVTKTLNMQMNTPFKVASLTGEVSGNQASVTARDETREVRALATKSDTGFEIKAFVNPNDSRYMIQVLGEYVPQNELQMSVSHGYLGQLVTDGEISLDLHDDHLVKSRFYYRPSLITDIKKSVQSLSIEGSPLRSALAGVHLAIAQEARNKGQKMVSALPNASPFITFVSAEAESFGNDAKVVKRAFNKMYWNNEFYMKSIDRTLDAAVTATWETMKVVSARVTEGFNNFVAAAARIMKPLKACLDVVGNTLAEAAEYVTDIMADLIDAYGPVMGDMCRKASSAIAAKYREMKTALSAKIMDCGRKLGQVALASLERVAVIVEPYVTGCIRLFNHLNAWTQATLAPIQAEFEDAVAAIPWETIESVWYTVQDCYMKYQSLAMFVAREIRQIDMLRPIYDARISLTYVITDIASYLTSYIAEVTRIYVIVLENVHDVISSAYTRFMATEQSVYVREAVRELADQIRWSYTYLDVEGKVQSIIESSLAFGIELLKLNLDYLTNNWLNLDMDRIITFAPRDGIMEFQFWIPTEYPTFQTLPFTEIDWTDMYKKAMTVLENLVPDDLNPWDVYYQYKPSTDIGEWIPPFETMATIAGQHITTFDGRTLEFLGTCSYVLARDVMDSTFTLINNYDKKYLTLVSDNKQVEVSLNGKVNVDASAVEAPYAYANTEITRVGDVLKVTNARGFSLECDLLNEMCVFRMSGWYHGKVAGMMGTYTNEPTDDFTMSNGETTTDVQELARSWEAMGSCKSHTNQAREYTMVEDSASGRICGALFISRLSPMRNCFKVVDPRPYLRACINDMQPRGDDKRGVCKVAAAYVARCHAKHVDVRPPRACVRAEEPVTTPSADVVYVIEQRSCNDDIVSKLDTMSKMIDRALNEKGLTKNRFGVVGFGGQGVHDREHTHTMSGQVFGTSRDIASIEPFLEISNNGENTDSLRALAMAIDYPFRYGASRSIVMVTCNTCHEESIAASDVGKKLADAGIQLHILVEHEFEMNTEQSIPKTSYLFGIDSSSAYTKSDVSGRDLSGDVDLYRQVVPPCDRCANMALRSEGSFFDLSKLTSGRVRTQKSFMDVFARRVAKTARSDSGLLGRPDEEPEIYYQDKSFVPDFEKYMRA